MDPIIERWKRAAERSADEKVRVVEIGGDYFATSSSQPLKSYRLTPGPEGWECECIANREYGMPCKHLWSLAEALGLDILSDIHVTWIENLPEPAVA